MSQDDDGQSHRKGKVSAFTLLTSWFFGKSSATPPHQETEFLNTRDGYELARFAKQAFGGDAEAKRRHEQAVAAEQAEIDELLQGTAAIPVPPHAPAPPGAVPEQPASAAGAHPPAAAPAPPVPVAAPAVQTPAPAGSLAAARSEPAVKARTPVEIAVKQLEALREQGLSVETLAEALIIIESRDVKKRGAAQN